MKPLVTIGMPTYNRADYLPRTINSILSQTFSDFELLIYDDGSSDNTLKVLESYNDKRINFVSFKNQGPPEPLNYIYKKSTAAFFRIFLCFSVAFYVEFAFFHIVPRFSMFFRVFLCFSVFFRVFPCLFSVFVHLFLKAFISI